MLNFLMKFLKVFPHQLPPQFTILNHLISKNASLVNRENACRNYLLTQRPKRKKSDFHLKSSILGKKDRLCTSRGNTHEGVNKSSVGDGPISCHYMQHPKSYDLTFKLAPRFALFIIGGSAAVRQGFGK